jgi:hypothetical protein
MNRGTGNGTAGNGERGTGNGRTMQAAEVLMQGKRLAGRLFPFPVPRSPFPSYIMAGI